MDFTIYIIISLSLSILSVYLILGMPFKKLMDIENDSELALYRYEAKNERNDGWTKQHFREKYSERLKFLLHEKGISAWWWRLHRWSSFQKTI